MWPSLRQSAPEVRLEIAGRNPPEWISTWAQSDPQVTLTASPEDIRPYIDRAAVFVCPITEGGGTRLKLLDAMAMGKAIVTTSIGCEGLRVIPDRDLLVADSPAEFNAAIFRLFEKLDVRQKMKQAARELVVREYSWNRVGDQLENAYRCSTGGPCNSSSGKMTDAVAPLSSVIT
jgi:glycosyltransferase involved in cell wall biosynthesis